MLPADSIAARVACDNVYVEPKHDNASGNTRSWQDGDRMPKRQLD